jgi:hypothetical protein
MVILGYQKYWQCSACGLLDSQVLLRLWRSWYFSSIYSWNSVQIIMHTIVLKSPWHSRRAVKLNSKMTGLDEMV